MRFGKIVGPVVVAVLAACSPPSESSGASSTTQAANRPAARQIPSGVAQAQAGEVSSSQIDAIVVEIMNQQYGKGHREEGSCWNFKYRDGERDVDYCMEPAKPELVGPAGRTMYLRVSNRADAEGAFDATTPGLMGAFQIAIESDGQWRYIAKSSALPFGTLGYCGCDKAKFVRLGSDYYGWIFTSGGTWQGVTVSNHEVVAAHDGAFKDLSDVPEIREDDQNTIYSIEVVAEPEQGGVKSLKVVKAISGKVQDERLVPFDQARWEYRMPELF
ncbi:hypothetical protein ACFPOA_00670 [Lysobacter niabensis]|uniref:hypothetical protein n=1 Tax=Agrilutibacter niabensis TaxID=380628 RepID=UPI0036084E7E